MHDEDIRPGLSAPFHEDEIMLSAPFHEDEIMERSVLTQVLFLHPAQLTILELALRVETDLRSCEQDAVERAVRSLPATGCSPAIAVASPPAGPLRALTS